MACPMGYSSKTLPVDGAEAEKVEEIIIPERDPEFFKPVAEPEILKTITPEAVFVLGGQYAILMQFAHPGLARGSAEHSNFANRIIERLTTTTRYLNVAIYGTPEEKEAITSVIHRYHSRVRGEGYYADDPELHKWTAATLFMSILVVKEMIWGPQPRYWKEELFKECSTFGTNLRMPTDMWPKTLDEFWEYWNHNCETLEVTDWARSLAKDLLYPKVPFWLWPISVPHGPFFRLMTYYWLPPRIRRDYGFNDTAVKRAINKLYQMQLKIVYRAIPKPLRTAGFSFYQRDMRKAVKRIQKTGHW